MATIETWYRTRFDYTWVGDSVDGQEALEKRAFQFASREPKVEIMAFDGCPACFPYIELESQNLAAIKRLAGKIERYINRRKDVKLLEEDPS